MLRFFLFFLTLLSFVGYTQNFTEQKLVDPYNIGLGEKLIKYKSNNDSLLFYAKKIQDSKNLRNIQTGKLFEALLFYRKNNLKKAETICNQIIEDLKDKEDYHLQRLRFDAYNRLFWIHKNQNKIHLAYNSLIEMDKIIKAISNKNDYKKVLHYGVQINIASIKSILGYNKEAKTILKSCVKDYEKNDRKNKQNNYSKIQFLSSAYNLLGKILLIENISDKNLDSASFYFKKAYQVAKKFNPPHENSETLYQLREAEVLIARKAYKESLDLINKYSIKQKQFNTYQKINALKAICFHHLKKSDSALIYAKQYLKNYDNNGNRKGKLIAIYNILANEYHSKQKLDSAFKYSELSLKELKIFEKNRNEVNKSHFLYNKKNIQDLNKKILEKEKFNSKKIIFSILLISLVIVLFFIKKNKKIKEHLNEIEKTDEQIVNPVTKKEYNINLEVEETILQGLKDLKNTSDFLKSDFNIKIFANQLNTNTTYISYVINKEYQKSFKEYLTEIRIEYLIEKLKKEKDYKKYTIKFLGEQIGYTNASAFTRAFKKHKGVTPSEFIKSLG